MIEHGGGRDRRLEAVAQERGLELVVGTRSQVVDGLVEPEIRRRTADGIDDQSGRQAFVPPPDNDVIGEAVRVLELGAGSVANRLCRRSAGGGHAEKPPVARTIVRDDPELIVPVINGVLDAFDPR